QHRERGRRSADHADLEADLLGQPDREWVEDRGRDQAAPLPQMLAEPLAPCPEHALSPYGCLMAAWRSQNATASSYFAGSIGRPEPPSARPSAWRSWVIGGIGGSWGSSVPMMLTMPQSQSGTAPPSGYSAASASSCARL